MNSKIQATGSIPLCLVYYLTHISLLGTHFPLNDQDITWGMQILTERKHVLRFGKWNHRPFSLQAKTLYCTASLICHLIISKFVVNHNSLGNRGYNVMLCYSVSLIHFLGWNLFWTTVKFVIKIRHDHMLYSFAYNVGQKPCFTAMPELSHPPYLSLISPQLFKWLGGGRRHYFSILDTTLETLTDLIISQSYMARKETPAYCSFV